MKLYQYSSKLISETDMLKNVSLQKKIEESENLAVKKLAGIAEIIDRQIYQFHIHLYQLNDKELEQARQIIHQDLRFLENRVKESERKN